MISKSPMMARIGVNEVGFKVPSYISPYLTRDFSLSFEALKPDTEFSSLATKLLDGIFF